MSTNLDKNKICDSIRKSKPNELLYLTVNSVDKNQLVKTVRDAPQSHLHVLSVSPLTKDSAKTAMNDLGKFLSRTGEYTIIAIKK